MPHRRHVLGAALLAPWVLARGAAAQPDAASLIGAGGVVVALRHADAPGNFDPPGFRLGDCATQRNLGDRGRAQAARIGAWYRERGLAPAAVRSSPWCRCLDTARLAFGAAEPWDLLGSPRGSTPEVNAARMPGLRAALAAVPRWRFEVWVTHMFVLADFVGQGAASGESLVLRAGPGDAVQVLARVPPA